MSGNQAMAEAALKAGCQLYAGYPITPQNELTAAMALRSLEEKRIFIQAESELAAINMVFGAAVSGLRAMTSSSGPGISLKQEGISYLAGAELPAVIINVMRAGPGLGSISSAQSDYFQATRGGGHGDYFTPTFAPWSVQEAAQLVDLCFDLADFYRTPVLVLADAIIGQMMEPLSFDFKKLFHKKLPDKPWALTGARNRSPNIIRSLLLKAGALEAHNEKLRQKWEAIKANQQRFDTYKVKETECLIIAYGSQARIAYEAVDILRSSGTRAGLFRPISLWPYPKKALRRVVGAGPARPSGIENIFVVEQSLGQMLEDVRLSLPNKKINFFGRAGGGIPSAAEIVEFVKKHA